LSNGRGRARSAGSDWETIKLMRVDSAGAVTQLPDTLNDVKFSSTGWTPDDKARTCRALTGQACACALQCARARARLLCTRATGRCAEGVQRPPSRSPGTPPAQRSACGAGVQAPPGAAARPARHPAASRRCSRCPSPTLPTLHLRAPRRASSTTATRPTATRPGRPRAPTRTSSCGTTWWARRRARMCSCWRCPTSRTGRWARASPTTSSARPPLHARCGLRAGPGQLAHSAVAHACMVKHDSSCSCVRGLLLPNPALCYPRACSLQRGAF